MSVMAPPPGWYPSAPGVVAWWDGQRWTGHTAPQAPAYPQVVRVDTGTNHVLHLLLTVLTCGLWLPAWILTAVLDGSPGGYEGLNRAGKATVWVVMAGVLVLYAVLTR